MCFSHIFQPHLLKLINYALVIDCAFMLELNIGKGRQMIHSLDYSTLLHYVATIDHTTVLAGYVCACSRELLSICAHILSTLLLHVAS